MLARHVDSGKIPGLVALVSRGGQTHVEAIGTMRHDGGAPMRRDTIFRMASTTKPVAASAAMVLLDECRLRLDDPIDQWIPELADRQVLKAPDGPLDETVPAFRPITVRDVLTSTLGLGLDMTARTAPMMAAIFERGVYGQADGWLLPEPDPDEWLRRLATLPLMYQPGERWLYNLGDDLVGVARPPRHRPAVRGLPARARPRAARHARHRLPRARRQDRPLPAPVRAPPRDRASSSSKTRPKADTTANRRRSPRAAAASTPPSTTTTPTSRCC